MRVTLLGVLGFLGLAALLVYAGYELHRMAQERNGQLRGIPIHSSHEHTVQSIGGFAACRMAHGS